MPLTSKDILKKTNDRKYSKKPHNLLFCIISSFVGIAIGAAFMFGVFISKKDHFRFELIGEDIINIEVGSTYEELGCIATLNEVDISKDVSINVYNEKNLLCELDTNKAARYHVYYDIDSNGLKGSIYRTVNVIDKVLPDDISIHFMKLGNIYSGDCIYIKAGETDVLIDAGSSTTSGEYICNYLNEYITDEKIEYVIATNSSSEHIGGFPKIFEKFDIDLIIDYAKTSDCTNDYEVARNAKVASGTKYYTAKECIKGNNGAKNEYNLGKEIKLEILNNIYNYEDEPDNNIKNCSVCILITQGENKYLFTSDLLQSGEKKLIANNYLSKVDLFKAGDHGSYMSSSLDLLNVVKPSLCVIPAVAGDDFYSKDKNNIFPSTAFISRIAKFTDSVYISTMKTTSNEVNDLNGNIIVSSKKGAKPEVQCSVSSNKLRNLSWYIDNRGTWPTN